MNQNLRVEMIPIDSISVINPRSRNLKVFNEIVTSIERVGLKRPITVRRSRRNSPGYDLVCGQGRLEAFQLLGQPVIPAVVIEGEQDDCLVMSLVENCARRNHGAVELLTNIGNLAERGYSLAEIAKKTGLSIDYVRDVLRLLSKGEHKLLTAVETGQIPITIATDIAEADDTDIQAALQRAYESNKLRGKELRAARRVIERRRRSGKGANPTRRPKAHEVSTTMLLKAYHEDAERKRQLVAKADAARDQLTFLGEALRTLFSDEHFVTLLRAEGLHDMPANLAERARQAA